jgi:hypothetical protein
MGSSTNRSLQRNHEKSQRQRREAGRIEGTKFARDVTTRQLALRAVTAFVHRVVEPSHPILKPDPKADDPVMVPYMAHRAPRQLTPAQRAYVNFAPELIKRR